VINESGKIVLRRRDIAAGLFGLEILVTDDNGFESCLPVGVGAAKTICIQSLNIGRNTMEAKSSLLRDYPFERNI